MKRLIKELQIFEEELDIDIYPQNQILSSTFILDTQSDEYNAFIDSMITMFANAGFELYSDPEYIHKSNKGSESWYYTFLKIEDLVAIKIIVNVRVSDHPLKDRKKHTGDELRQNYMKRVSRQLSKEYELTDEPLVTAVNVVIDGERVTDSYTAAELYLKSKIREIVRDYNEWKQGET